MLRKVSASQSQTSVVAAIVAVAAFELPVKFAAGRLAKLDVEQSDR